MRIRELLPLNEAALEEIVLETLGSILSVRPVLVESLA
jgi:hypothetical protein